MELHIISPTKTDTLLIEWLEVETSHGGSFIIQKGHAPLLLILAHNKPITFMSAHGSHNGKTESIPVGHGILESDRTRITIIMRDMR